MPPKQEKIDVDFNVLNSEDVPFSRFRLNTLSTRINYSNKIIFFNFKCMQTPYSTVFLKPKYDKIYWLFAYAAYTNLRSMRPI